MTQDELFKQVFELAVRCSKVDTKECPEAKLVSGTLYTVAAVIGSEKEKKIEFGLMMREFNKKYLRPEQGKENVH